MRSAVLWAIVVAGCASPPYFPLREPGGGRGASPEVEHRQGSFVGAKETRLYEQSWRPGHNVRAALVIVHGLKDHGGRYREVATALAEMGIAVHLFDLPGHGYSEGVREHVEAFEDYVEDLHRFLARVSDREASVPLFVLGHDLGGTIGALHTVRRKPNLAGLILSAPLLRAELGAGTKMAASLMPKKQSLKADLSRRVRDRAGVEALKSDPLVYTGDGTARLARELAVATTELRMRLTEIAVPLLVLHGSRDEIAGVADSRALEKLAKSQYKAITVYPGAAHDLFHGAEREQVADDVARWIRERLKPPEPKKAPPSRSPKKLARL